MLIAKCSTHPIPVTGNLPRLHSETRLLGHILESAAWGSRRKFRSVIADIDCLSFESEGVPGGVAGALVEEVPEAMPTVTSDLSSAIYLEYLNQVLPVRAHPWTDSHHAQRYGTLAVVVKCDHGLRASH